MEKTIKNTTITILVFMFLFLMPVVSFAAVEDIYGTWSGDWYVDEMYFNDNGEYKYYYWDGSSWIPEPLYEDNTPSPSNPYEFTLVLHALDEGDNDYGKLYMPGDNIFDGWVTILNEFTIDNENIFEIVISYDEYNEDLYGAIYAVLTNEKTLTGDFDENPTPPVGYITWQGHVELTPVPLPSSAMLLASGLFAFLRFRRKGSAPNNM